MATVLAAGHDSYSDPMPTRFVALLRGVNLGPNRRVAMPALKALGEDLGFTDVSTFLNSGNLLFAADAREPTVVRNLEAALAKQFGGDIPVAVRSAADLAKAVAASPFADGDPSRVLVCFLDQPPSDKAVRALMDAAGPTEVVRVAGRELHLHLPDGQASSKLAATLPKLVGRRVCTARNLRTCSRLAALLGG